MNFNLFKIDTWWKAVFILGLISCFGSLFSKINFINQKHLFGLGLGMILIGLSNWIAWKTFSKPSTDGILSWKSIKHNFISFTLLIIGVFLTILFGFNLIKALL